MIAYFESCMLKGPVDYADSLDAIQDIGLYVDPALEDKISFAESIKELFDSKIIGLTDRPKGRVGTFSLPRRRRMGNDAHVVGSSWIVVVLTRCFARHQGLC